MKFFVDNCLPPKMARALNEISQPNNSFVHIKDHPSISQHSTDLDWINLLSREGGWIIITKDNHIMKRPVEKEAFKAAKLTGFFLDNSWSHLDFFELLSKLSSRMPRILELATKNPSGKCFRIRVKSSKIEEI